MHFVEVENGGKPMQTLGDFLEQLGPVWAVLFMVLVLGLGVASILVGLPTLIRGERRAI